MKAWKVIELFCVLSRLSDVVKAVKSMVVREKEEPERSSGEIVVSARFGESSAYVVVSVASPTGEVEGWKSSRAHLHFPSAPATSAAHQNPRNKKYREVDVGSADDNYDIRASTSK